MNVVSKATLPPGFCFICAQSWDVTGDPTRFVHTDFIFEPGGYTNHNGVKYICEHCVREAAKLLAIEDEFVSSASVEELRVAAAEAAYVASQVAQDLKAAAVGLNGIAKGLKMNV